jgi:putative transposase
MPERTHLTQYQVSLGAQTLQRLASGDGHLVRLLESLQNQVLEAQVSEQLLAERYERIGERQHYRNGYTYRASSRRGSAP